MCEVGVLPGVAERSNGSRGDERGPNARRKLSAERNKVQVFQVRHGHHRRMARKSGRQTRQASPANDFG